MNQGIVHWFKLRHSIFQVLVRGECGSFFLPEILLNCEGDMNHGPGIYYREYVENKFSMRVSEQRVP